MRPPFILTGILAVALPLPGAAAASPAPAEMKLTIDGPVLVTTEGMSLYTFGENPQGSQAKWQCTNVPLRNADDQQSGIGERPGIGYKLVKSCLDKFKPYVPDGQAQPVGDYTIVIRPEGTKQWAYKGVPLYTSIKDRNPGERNASGARGAGGGGGGGFGRGGLQFAFSELTVVPGLQVARRAEGLVLVSSDTQRPVYTRSEKGHVIKTISGREDFRPINAPALARVSGEWSVAETGAGIKQYAFRGKPLYSAPASLNELEIAEATGWEPVVLVNPPPVPSSIGQKLTLAGDVYTTREGMTLYTYNCNVSGGQLKVRPTVTVSCDEAGDPAAYMVSLCGDGKECARRWRPYLAASSAKPEGEFGIVDITYPMFTDMRGELYPADAPKLKAWAYRGKPLFTYHEDEKPGDIWGDSTGGIWGASFGAANVPGRSATFFEP